MSAPLQPCLGCARHVRATETQCPFCALPVDAATPRASPSTRLSRAALFAFGATVAACGGPQQAPPPSETTIMQPYGAPPTNPDPDPNPPPTSTTQNDPEPGTVVAAYGAAPAPTPVAPPRP